MALADTEDFKLFLDLFEVDSTNKETMDTYSELQKACKDLFMEVKDLSDADYERLTRKSPDIK